jgi:hypothetical protein
VEINPHPEGLELLRVVAPEFDATFEVYGNCPVQGFGTVGGRDLYFHARHDGWTFDVAHSDGFYREAAYPNASWMPHREAVEFIAGCLPEYTSARA